MSPAACTFSRANQRTLCFSYVLKQPEQMRERKEEENVWGAEGGGAAAEAGAWWSFSLPLESFVLDELHTAAAVVMHLLFLF